MATTDHSHPSKSIRQSWWVRGLILAICVAVAIGVRWKLRKGSTEEQQVQIPTTRIGKVRPKQEFGVFETERNDKKQTYRWTNGEAKFVIPIETRPRALLIRADIQWKQPGRVCLKANGKTLYDQTTNPQNGWTRTFSLAGVEMQDELTIELLSATEVPAELYPKSQDRRKLGMKIHELELIDTDINYLDRALVVAAVAGVEESGFYSPERDAGGKPLRWSKGDFQVVVPLGDKKPIALELDLEIPNVSVPKLLIRANGITLVDDKPRARSVWSRKLPLDQVSMSDKITFEFECATDEPSAARAARGDPRPFGVRVNKFVLVSRE